MLYSNSSSTCRWNHHVLHQPLSDFRQAGTEKVLVLIAHSIPLLSPTHRIPTEGDGTIISTLERELLSSALRLGLK